MKRGTFLKIWLGLPFVGALPKLKPEEPPCPRCQGDKQVVYTPAELERVDLSAFKANPPTRLDIFPTEGGDQAFGGPCPVCREEDFLAAFPQRHVPTASEHHEAYVKVCATSSDPADQAAARLWNDFLAKSPLDSFLKEVAETFRRAQDRIWRGIG